MAPRSSVFEENDPCDLGVKRHVPRPGRSKGKIVRYMAQHLRFLISRLPVPCQLGIDSHRNPLIQSCRRQTRIFPADPDIRREVRSPVFRAVHPNDDSEEDRNNWHGLILPDQVTARLTSSSAARPVSPPYDQCKRREGGAAAPTISTP